jgi:hypothetical protein
MHQDYDYLICGLYCPDCNAPLFNNEDDIIIYCPKCEVRLRRYTRETVACIKCDKIFWRNLGEARSMCQTCVGILTADAQYYGNAYNLIIYYNKGFELIGDEDD